MVLTVAKASLGLSIWRKNKIMSAQMLSLAGRSTRFYEWSISLLFAVVWIGLLQYSLPFPDIVLRFILPLVLIVLCLQYHSHRAYFFVMSVFIASFLLNASSLPFYWQLHLSQMGEGNQLISYSFCGICEVRNNLWMMLAAMLALTLLHSRLMTERFQWSHRSFFIALINGGLLYGLFQMV